MGENKYEKGKIYKIVDVGYSKCYIGSTTEALSKRLARHKSSYECFLKCGGKNTRSFDLFKEFGIENCKIELIESYPCAKKKSYIKGKVSTYKDTKIV